MVDPELSRLAQLQDYFGDLAFFFSKHVLDVLFLALILLLHRVFNRIFGERKKENEKTKSDKSGEPKKSSEQTSSEKNT